MQNSKSLVPGMQADYRHDMLTCEAKESSCLKGLFQHCDACRDFLEHINYYVLNSGVMQLLLIKS